NRGGGDAAQYLLATFGVFGVMGAALFGFGVTVATDRAEGLLALKRALPMPPGAYLLAKIAMALLFSTLVAVLLAVMAALFGGVSLAPGQWALLLLAHVAGALPFCAIGLYVGTLAGGSAAPVVVNLLYLPMSFLSGLWLPLSMLPAVLARLAPAWPSYHMGQVALNVVGMDAGQPLALPLAVPAAVTTGLFVPARARLARRGWILTEYCHEALARDPRCNRHRRRHRRCRPRPVAGVEGRRRGGDRRYRRRAAVRRPGRGLRHCRCPRVRRRARAAGRQRHCP